MGFRGNQLAGEKSGRTSAAGYGPKGASHERSVPGISPEFDPGYRHQPILSSHGVTGMSTRERWIVYPLLFMTLGIALRDKVLPSSKNLIRLDADEIRCNRLLANEVDGSNVECGVLTVAESGGQECLRMGVAGNKTGRLELCGNDGKVVAVLRADESGKAGVLETFTTEGNPLVQLRSTEGGGVIWTIDRNKRVLLVLGHYEEDFGIFAEVPGRRIPLTLPLRRTDKPGGIDTGKPGPSSAPTEKSSTAAQPQQGAEAPGSESSP